MKFFLFFIIFTVIAVLARKPTRKKMLIPNRFSNLQFSLVNVTALVIDCLLQDRDSSVDEIVRHLRNFSKDFDRDDVLKAATFLYAMGKVEYCEKSDRLKLMGCNYDMDVNRA